MLRRIRQRWRDFHLSLREKLTLSLSAIAVVLLVSSIISVLEYRRMSTYVSGIIADDIRNIHVAQNLLNLVDDYNLNILAVIGDEDLNTLPDFDQQQFVFACDSLKGALSGDTMLPMTDSVLYAFSAYMLTSLELESILSSDEDSRNWYFDRLQPVFHRMRDYMEDLSDVLYDQLQLNSQEFDRGFYRSIIPSSVAVVVGILLIILLLFFILSYYIRPLYKMLAALDDYRSVGKKYNLDFDGDDQLTELNGGIRELADENRQLRRRLKDLKERLSGE